jgi:hypothetical protein
MVLWKGNSGVTRDPPLACGGRVDFGWSSSIIIIRTTWWLTDKGGEAFCHVPAGSAAARGSTCLCLAGKARNTRVILKESRAP